MAVHKYKSYDLRPRKKSLQELSWDWMVWHWPLVVGVLGVLLLIGLCVLYSQAQLDYMMKYGSLV
jgi:hypothetical protein